MQQYNNLNNALLIKSKDFSKTNPIDRLCLDKTLPIYF